jgi:hypothetical protein
MEQMISYIGAVLTVLQPCHSSSSGSTGASCVVSSGSTGASCVVRDLDAYLAAS